LHTLSSFFIPPSNTDILVKNKLLGVNETHNYEQTMSMLNGTELTRLQLSECSLAHELDNVSTVGMRDPSI